VSVPTEARVAPASSSLLRALRGAPIAALTLAATLATLTLAAARVAVDPRTFRGDFAGVLGPGAALLGVAPQTLTLVAWLAALGLAALAAFHARAGFRHPIAVATQRRDEEPGLAAVDGAPFFAASRLASHALLTVCVAGLALRVHDALRTGWDIDEPWAEPSRASLFDDSHDALIHPPLGRALFEGWGAVVGWNPGDAPALLRAPSTLFGALTLGLVALFARRRVPHARAPAALAGLALLGAALSPPAREVACLARPYALATFLVLALVVLVFDAHGRRFAPAEAAAAALAASLAWFVDLPAGLFAALVVLLRALHDLADGRMRGAGALVAASALPALPLLPGAWRAVTLGIDPTHSPIAGPIPDLRPLADTPGLARAASLTQALVHSLPAWSVLLALPVIVVALLRRRAYLPGFVAALAAALPLALLPFVALRARNVAWAPLVVCAALATLARPLLPRAPCDTSAAPTRD
jgi:hypothetical protein